MKRNDFFKTCVAGVCGCGVMGLLAPAVVRAETADGQTPTAPADCEQLKLQLDGARERFVKLLSVMDKKLDDATRREILLGLGRECAQPYVPFFEKYRGDLKGFLAKIKTAWLERADFDEKAGVLHTVGKAGPCACPLVKIGLTPAQFCTCSLGWNQLAFSTVLGKPVPIEIEESVLRGGSRCSFRVKI
jgi:hypothetical protein